MSDGGIEGPIRREPKSTNLKVQDALKRDVGKSLARIDQEVMKLSLTASDIELISPKKNSTSHIIPARPRFRFHPYRPNSKNISVS